MTKQLTPKLLLSILAVGLLSFTDIMLETALNVSFPILMTTFGINASTVHWLTSGVILLTAMVVILSPWLKNNFSYRQLFVFAAVVSMTGIVIDAVSQQFALVLFGRLLQGVGAGIGMPLMYNLIFEQVPDNRRGTMMGMGSLIISFAPALGPAIGGWLSEAYGWQMIFWVVLPVQAFALVLGLLTLVESGEKSHVRLDIVGWLLLSAFFIAGIFVLPSLSDHGLNLQTLFWLAVIVVGIGGYAWHAPRHDNALLDVSLFRHAPLVAAAIAAVITQVIYLSYIYLVPMALQISVGTSATVAGLAMLPGAFGYAVIAFFSGRLYDLYGAKIPVGTGAMLMISAIGLLNLVPLTQFNLIALNTMLSIGAGFWFGNNMTAVVSALPIPLQSAGSALFTAINNYSAAVGIAVGSAIIAVAQRLVEAPIAQATQVGAQWLHHANLVGIVLAMSLSWWAVRQVKR
jgi:EmrB/QacA subfamily drug resistance transporter